MIPVKIEKRPLKSGKVSYRLVWHANGERGRTPLGVIDLKEAKRLARRKELELAGMPTQSTRDGLVFGPYAEKYLQWYQSENAKTTYDRIKRAFEVFLIPEFGNLTLDEISVALLREYKFKRLNGELINQHDRVPKKATVDKELATLKRMLTYAVEQNDLAVNPVDDYKIPKAKKSTKRISYTPAQLQKIYEAAKRPGHMHWWQLFANTGLRRAEAMKMRWDDISEGMIIIESLEEDERTKSGEYREIPVTAGAKEALKTFKKLQGTTEFVFPRLKLPSITQAAKRDIRQAGLRGTLHCLRHTYCTALLRAGTDLETVRYFMGHDSIETTQLYLHADKSDYKKFHELNF